MAEIFKYICLLFYCMVEQTYTKNDLQDYVDGNVAQLLEDEDAEYDFQKYPSRRSKAITQVLPDNAEVYSEFVGMYQGEYVLCIVLDDYIWLRNNIYGSCSGCDPYQADPVAETESIIQDAYCFESIEDACLYLETTDSFGWQEGDIREKSIEMLRTDVGTN